MSNERWRDSWRDQYDDWKLRSPEDDRMDDGEIPGAEQDLLNEINRMEREISALRAALDECLEYFQDEQDAWTDDGQWVSNKQMKLGVMVEEVLTKKEFK